MDAFVIAQVGGPDIGVESLSKTLKTRKFCLVTEFRACRSEFASVIG